MTPEARIRNLICSWLRLKRALIFIHDSVGIYDPRRKVFLANHNPYRMKGVADLIGIWNGKPLAIEVKSGKNKPTDHQERFLKTWEEAGGIAILAYSLDDVTKRLSEPLIDTQKRNP